MSSVYHIKMELLITNLETDAEQAAIYWISERSGLEIQVQQSLAFKGTYMGKSIDREDSPELKP